MLMQTYACPYCRHATFRGEFLETVSVVGAVEGYNQCGNCDKWSKYQEGRGQMVITDPNTKPSI